MNMMARYARWVLLAFLTSGGAAVPCQELLSGKCACTWTKPDTLMIHNCKDLTEVPDFSTMDKGELDIIGHLDLSGQKITHISKDHFDMLPKQRIVLDLSDNLIQSVGQGTFDHFDLHYKIFLDGNLLERIPTEGFETSTDYSILDTLSLSRNRIQTLNSSELLALPINDPIFKIDLSFNPISQSFYQGGTPSNKLHDNLNALNLSHTELTKIPRSFLTRSLNTLDLSSTGITEIENLAFAVMGYKYEGQVTVDISNNRILTHGDHPFSAVDKINDLRMANCTLDRLPQKVLSFKALTRLDLSDNLITRFYVPPPEYSGYLLEELNMSGNKLTHVPTGLCRRYPNLSLLDLYGNPIDAELSLELFSSCNVASFSVYWPKASMNCSCSSFISWYDNPKASTFKAYNCAYTDGPDCHDGRKVVCASDSIDADLIGRNVTDIDREVTGQLCGGVGELLVSKYSVLILATTVLSYLISL